MPIALLLTVPIDSLMRGLRRWRRWEDLAETEALLLKRERGRFVSRWFGTAIPTEGLALLVSIQNLDEIRAAVSGANSTKMKAIGIPEKASLLEPLLSGTGPLVGALAFPLNSLMLGKAATDLGSTWWQVALGGIVWVTGGLVGSVVVSIAGLVGPIGIGAMLGGLSSTSDGRALLGLLERLVPIGQLLRELVDQLSGPRHLIVNPLLRAVFDVGDAVAGLLGELIGASFFVVTRVVPLLGPLSESTVAMVALGRSVMGLLEAVMHDIVTGLPGLFETESGPFAIVLRAFPALVGSVGDLLGRRGAEATALIKDRLEPVSREAKGFSAEFDPSFVVKDHPLVVALGTLPKSGGVLGTYWASFLTLIPVIGSAIVSAVSGPSSPPSATGSFVKRLLGVPPAPPSLGPLPGLPTPISKAEAVTRAPWAELDAVAAATSAASVAYGAPRPAVFAGARAQLERDKLVAAQRAAEAAVYLRLARHAVAPAVAGHIRPAEEVLRDLDARARPVDRRVFPVREILPVQPLHLDVKRLVVTGEGKAEAPLRRFSGELSRAMRRQVYEIELAGV